MGQNSKRLVTLLGLCGLGVLGVGIGAAASTTHSDPRPSRSIEESFSKARASGEIGVMDSSGRPRGTIPFPVDHSAYPKGLIPVHAADGTLTGYVGGGTGFIERDVAEAPGFDPDAYAAEQRAANADAFARAQAQAEQATSGARR